MAKATPVTAAAAEAESPAKAVEIKMAPVEQPKPAAAPKADPKELEALVAEAAAADKVAMVVGNAVRVDH